MVPESNNASVQARDAAKCKNVNKICPCRRRPYSAAIGSLTLSNKSASAHTWSAVPTSCAPAALKSASVIAEPSPAPAWMSTSWPRRVSSATPAGVMATRNSLFLVSVGIPTRMITPLDTVRFSMKKVRLICKIADDNSFSRPYA